MTQQQRHLETGSPEQQTAQPQTVSQMIQTIADQTGLDAHKIRVNRDMGTILQYMQSGIIINLHMTRPRFSVSAKHTQRALGLKTTSGEAQEVINNYFRLGTHSVLPKRYQDLLNNAEQCARGNLKNYSVKTHWGMFVPLTHFDDWKREDDRFRQQFEAARDTILANYHSILDEVIEEYRPMAEDAWKRETFGQTYYERSATALEREIMAEVASSLHYEMGKDAFITNYLATIRNSFPSQLEIARGFKYDPEPSFVPLPSMLARDADLASQIVTQTEIDRARQELEISRERERSEAQSRMEQFVLESARSQRDALVSEFFEDVVGQINGYLAETCDKVLTSTAKKNTLPGPTSEALFMLVDRLEKMNFINNEDVSRQIAEIKAVLPTPEERTRARKGIARIDVSKINTTLTRIRQEANEVLLDLDTEPKVRRIKKDIEIEPVTVETPVKRQKFTLGDGDQSQEVVKKTRNTWSL